MTSDRKAILVFLGVSVVVLGAAFTQRLKSEKKDISGIRAKQESASNEARFSNITATELSGGSDCIYGYPDPVSLLRADGSELCLTFEHSSQGDRAKGSGWDRFTHVFTLVQSDGSKQELARRVEGFAYDEKKQEYIPVTGVPFASNWQPIGMSEDQKLAYFTRAQGLPVDGPGTNNPLELWSMNFDTGELKQVLKVGDLIKYWTSAYIGDVHIGSQRVIVRNGKNVSVIGFDGKVIVKSVGIPFVLKEAESLIDAETYRFREDGLYISVTATREEPYGSGKIHEYGPVWFELLTKKFIP